MVSIDSKIGLQLGYKPKSISKLKSLPCYRLDKRLDCLVVGAILLGSAVHMTHVSYTSRASVRGPVGGH